MFKLYAIDDESILDESSTKKLYISSEGTGKALVDGEGGERGRDGTEAQGHDFGSRPYISCRGLSSTLTAQNSRDDVMSLALALRTSNYLISHNL